MLSTFPGILYLAPFAATILRFGAGLSFIYVGYVLILRRGNVSSVRLPWIGHAPQWLTILVGAITLIDGFAIFLGFGTQIAAIVGMILALKFVILWKRFEPVHILARSTYFLLFLMCLALLLTGAGPYGFDLPL